MEGVRAITIGALLIAASASSCGPTGSADRSDAASPTPSDVGEEVEYLGPLRFDWPTDCVVQVRESIRKNGDEVELRYSIQLHRLDNGLRLTFLNTQADSVNGVELTAEQQAEVAGQFTYPWMRVEGGEQPDLIEVGRWDALAERAGAAELPDGFMQQIAFNYMDLAWTAWVWMWAGVTIDAIEISPYRADELDPAAETSFRSLPAPPGLARLSLDTNKDGAEALASFADELGQGRQLDIENAEIVFAERVEALTDPKNLRPIDVRLDRRMTGEADGERLDLARSNHWTFDWEGSNCPA